MNKAWFLKAATVLLISGALFFLLEISLRVLYKNELRDMRTTPSVLQEYLWDPPRIFIENQKGRYETNIAGLGGLARVQIQHFEMPKRKGLYRIFCAGGSSVQGVPYAGSRERADPGKAFPARLEEILKKDFKNIEVINAGLGASSSPQLLALVKELTQYEPDCIILYAGHNEYGYYFWQPEVLKIPAWRLKAARWLDRLYVYRFICKITRQTVPINNENSGVWRKYAAGEEGAESHLEKKYKHMIPSKEWEGFVRKELLLSEVTFEKNLFEMKRVLEEKNIKFMICTLVSNLKDFPPIFNFHSPGLSKKDLLRWEDLYEEAKRSMASADPDRTLRELKRLAALDGRYAETYYLLGQVYYALGDYAQARKNYILAKDLSPAYCPFQRAPSSLNELIRSFARENNVYLVDIEEDFYSLKDNFGIPGEDLFWVNLHPNEQGYRLIAASIAQAMKRLKLIPATV